MGGYDASGDYWRLMRNGKLQYDGKATLTDEDGNVLMSYEQMGVSSDNVIEGSLAYLLTGKHDEAAAALARQYMLEAKMVHTNNDKPADKWLWKGGENNEITNENMGKGIKLFDKLGTIGTTMVSQLFAGLFDYQTDVEASYLLQGLDATKDISEQQAVYNGMKAILGTGPKKPILGGIAQIGLGTNLGNTELAARYNALLDAKVGFYLDRTVFLQDGLESAGRDIRLTDNQDFGSKHPGVYKFTNDVHVGGDFVFEKPGTIAGLAVLMPFSGKVDNKVTWDQDKKESGGGGNIITVEYGFQFEDTFISQHVYGKSMHLQNEGTLQKGKWYNAGTVVGAVGNTGSNSTGFHLHQEFYIPNKIDTREEQLKYNLMFGTWNKKLFEGYFLAQPNSTLNLNFAGNKNDNRTYINTVQYLEELYGRRLRWQNGGTR